ncbi:MAG TPA: tyrosine--tRNA ligase [Gemmatimonadaceae bacterium]|nr:tyrosine--tRNA ligase [Gemmatimonadaceae bacterium]
MPATVSLLDELSWRGLLHQYTDGLAESLAEKQRSAYCGFDPTASSLHVGNLVPVMGLVHLQRAGHRPIALVGGGTGMIGDPSGKASERPLATPEIVEQNAASLHSQLERFLEFDGPAAATMMNNAEWLAPLGAIEMLRDVGKHFTVNYMLQKEAVKGRMEAGISFTEFAYMLLQAYDYLQIHRRTGATLQVGGSDQWGNITAGVELIRRVEGAHAHALTFPLITSASGTKFGKTEAGAVWLDPSRTSPYKFYQFWINADDRDASQYLRIFTLMPREEIEALEAELRAHPERRQAQQALAREVTTRVHGAETTRVVERASRVLFDKELDPTMVDEAVLTSLREEIPFAEIPAPADGAIDVLDLFTGAGLAASKGAARRLLEQGGLTVNGRRLEAAQRSIGTDALLPGRYLLLKKGAREYALVRVKS